MARTTFILLALFAATSNALKVHESPFANPTLERFMAQAYASTAELANNIAKAASPLLNLEKKADDLAHDRPAQDEKNYKEESLLEAGSAKKEPHPGEDLLESGNWGEDDPKVVEARARPESDEKAEENNEEAEDSEDSESSEDSEDSEDSEAKEAREHNSKEFAGNGGHHLANEVVNDCCHPDEMLVPSESCSAQEVRNACCGMYQINGVAPAGFDPVANECPGASDSDSDSDSDGGSSGNGMNNGPNLR